MLNLVILRSVTKNLGCQHSYDSRNVRLSVTLKDKIIFRTIQEIVYVRCILFTRKDPKEKREINISCPNGYSLPQLT